MGKIYLTVFLALSSTIYSQKYELGKVTIKELSEKVHPKDTSAVAAVLFQKGSTFFTFSQNTGFEKVTKVQSRIKIYKKEGYDWANHVVPYYLEGDIKENLSFSDAVTYNLVDDKIEKTKLKSEGEFDEKLNRYWGQKKITMPNVKEGSIIEFEYTIKSSNFGHLKDWEFQYNIPVNYTEYKTSVPEFYVYKEKQKGYFFPKKEVNVVPKLQIVTSKERVGSNSVRTHFNEEELRYNESQTLYTAIDVPAIRDEKFVNNIKNYSSSISHELSMIKFPNESPREFSTDWESVAKTIYENEDFGDELNKTGYFENDVNALIAGLSSREEKIATIFTFVKSKVKWNNYYGYSCNDGVKAAYKKQSGNVGEINLMLTAMLRYAGIEANPVLLSTRSNGIEYFPNRKAFNYVIAAVEIENDLILLDATDKNSLPNILPIRDLNWFGRIIRKGGSSAQVNLMPKGVSKGVTNAIVSIDQQGKVVGKIRKQYFDYSAYSFRNQYGDLSKESYLEEFEKENKGIEVGEYESLNIRDLGKPVVENFSFESNNSVEIIGDKMYFSPMLFLAWSKNPFTQEKREYPIDFGYPTQDKFMVSISIPDGYVVESIPESKAISLPEGMGLFKINVAKKENQVQLMLNRDFNAPIVSAEYYEALKQFFDIMVKSETDKVILKKV